MAKHAEKIINVYLPKALFSELVMHSIIKIIAPGANEDIAVLALNQNETDNVFRLIPPPLLKIAPSTHAIQSDNIIENTRKALYVGRLLFVRYRAIPTLIDRSSPKTPKSII